MVAATVAVLAALAVPTVEVQAADLFTPVDETPPPGPPDDITLRSRVVTIDLGQLDRAQATVADPSVPTTQTRDTSPRKRALRGRGVSVRLRLSQLRPGFV